MQRMDWTVKPIKRKLDLSINVHYDDILNRAIKIILQSHDSFNNYPYQYDLYQSVSDYHNIDIKNIAIGYGATEILERIFKTLEFKNVYVVEPNFQMVEVYCSIYNKRYIPITIDDLQTLPVAHNSILVVANPNGNNGEVHDISNMPSKFKYVISDEVYADFNSTYSLLRNTPKNVIVVKSFSKSLGLAGYRCGFAVASEEIIHDLQQVRSNFVMTSFAATVIPKVIHMTDGVVSRMQETKQYLESSFECKPSQGNYVLFRVPNVYTETFGAKEVGGYLRMALTDMETLNDYKSY